MNISGTATVHAPPGAVWAALIDPAVLCAAIPGCERIEQASPGHWRFALTVGVASIRGTITGDAKVADRPEPSSLNLAASAAGGPGTVTATVRISLAAGAGDTTALSYDADAAIDGQLASVGRRVLTSTATRMAGQFVNAIDEILARNGVVSPAPAQPARPAGPHPAVDAEATSLLPGILAGGAAGAVAGFVAARLIARRGR